MSPCLALRATAGFVACVSAIALAAPAVADPMDPIPGTGVFLVGPDIAPGTYRTQGPSGPLILVFGKVSELSTCMWLLHSTPEASDGDIVNSGSGLSPMLATIPPNVKAFETKNCQPWSRV
ncbi:MAG: hypothetical protein QOD58_1359 [Mycobacterium sp.]|jgi:hypothetical protein|nr:hypothetical protein [Mycobacterium sp.]